MLTVTLPDAQWNSLYAALQTLPGLYVGQEAKVRRFVEGVLWILRSGSQWRLLPEDYGPWNSLYKRFARWSERGVWEALLRHAAHDPDLEWLLLDSTTIRAHPCAAGASKKTAGKPPKPSGAVAAVSARRSTR